MSGEPGEFISFLVHVREAHGVNRNQLAKCLNKYRKTTADSLRQIERGRNQMPDFRDGLIEWVRHYLQCAGATLEEEKKAIELASATFVGEFAEWLRDINNREK